ncbi:MAG: hypothetical protein HS114_19270 [Anaerolineales bacterium]|nr:hypothetical protein [Anaerolineales bacterium]
MSQVRAHQQGRKVQAVNRPGWRQPLTCRPTPTAWRSQLTGQKIGV